MAVQDLWRDRRGQPTKRAGVGRRWRVVVAGQPTRSFTNERAAKLYEAKLLAEGPARPQDRATTVGDQVDVWLASKQRLSTKGR